MVQHWTIDGVSTISSTGKQFDAAYLLKLSLGEEKARTVVEFVAPASVASAGYAKEVMTKFLGSDEPPRRLIIARDGSVEVAALPGGAQPVAARPPRPQASQGPRRARSHGRG